MSVNSLLVKYLCGIIVNSNTIVFSIHIKIILDKPVRDAVLKHLL